MVLTCSARERKSASKSRCDQAVLVFNVIFYAMKNLLSGSIALLASLFSLTACDSHFDFPDTSMREYDILCTDGDILRFHDYEKSGKEAIGVIFYVNNDPEVEGRGYAVYLYDLVPEAMSDTCGVSQRTSADLDALDGNANTYELMNAPNSSSPLAAAVFELWRFGQSAYIPSVAQYRLLWGHKGGVNDMLARCGGDLLPDLAEDCWYWSSTEVSGQSSQKGWLFSMESGSIQETPKTQAHKSRPVITINY